VDTLLSANARKAEMSVRIVEKTAERLVGSEETLATPDVRKKTRRGGEGREREKWRPRAEITSVFLI